METIQKILTGFKSGTAVIIMLIVCGFHFSTVSGQDVKFTNGTYVVNNGVVMVVNNARLLNLGNMTINAAASVKLNGNLQNDGIFNGLTGSSVTLNGTSSQSVGGSNTSTFGNLTLSNSSGIILAKTITVNGTLTLQNGLVTTGANTMIIGPSGSIANAGSSRYISGKLGLTFDAIGSKVFPLGKGGIYRPLTFQYTGLSGTSIVTAEQFESGLSGTMPPNVTLLTTSRSWTISQTGGTNLQYFVSLAATGYTPTRQVMMLKQDGGAIMCFPATSPNYTNAIALTGFSDFGLGEAPAAPGMTGSFAYNNTANTPLDSVWVILKQNNVRIDSVRTTLAGTYSFTGKPSGTYTISARSNKIWQSVNATDALKVQRHFAGVEPFTVSVRLLAADVNLTNSINATDAVKIKRRFSGLETSFTRGDWVFEKVTGGDTLAYAGGSLYTQFFGLLVGDVNGSNIPGTGAKNAGLISLEQENEIKALPGEIIEIPIRVDNEVNIGAISLVIDYPEHLMQVREVRIPEGAPVYTAENGSVRLAWSETQPLYLTTGETLITLIAKISDQFPINDNIRLSLTRESEIADAEGKVVNNLVLRAPSVIHKNATGVDNPENNVTKFELYPVPNNGIFTAEITSARQKTYDILIYNKLGQVVFEMLNVKVNGKFKQIFDLRNLQSGIYTGVLKNDEEAITKKILINK